MIRRISGDPFHTSSVLHNRRIQIRVQFCVRIDEFGQAIQAKPVNAASL